MLAHVTCGTRSTHKNQGPLAAAGSNRHRFQCLLMYRTARSLCLTYHTKYDVDLALPQLYRTNHIKTHPPACSQPSVLMAFQLSQNRHYSSSTWYMYPTRVPLLQAAVDTDFHARSCTKQYMIYPTKLPLAVAGIDLRARSCAAGWSYVPNQGVNSSSRRRFLCSTRAKQYIIYPAKLPLAVAATHIDFRCSLILCRSARSISTSLTIV